MPLKSYVTVAQPDLSQSCSHAVLFLRRTESPIYTPVHRSDGCVGLSWMKERKVKNSVQPLELKPASLMIKRSRLSWFGRVERKYDTHWVKRCMTRKVEGIKTQRTPEKDLMGLR